MLIKFDGNKDVAFRALKQQLEEEKEAMRLAVIQYKLCEVVCNAVKAALNSRMHMSNVDQLVQEIEEQCLRDKIDINKITIQVELTSYYIIIFHSISFCINDVLACTESANTDMSFCLSAAVCTAE